MPKLSKKITSSNKQSKQSKESKQSKQSNKGKKTNKNKQNNRSKKTNENKQNNRSNQNKQNNQSKSKLSFLSSFFNIFKRKNNIDDMISENKESLNYKSILEKDIDIENLEDKDVALLDSTFNLRFDYFQNKNQSGSIDFYIVLEKNKYKFVFKKVVYYSNNKTFNDPKYEDIKDKLIFSKFNYVNKSEVPQRIYYYKDKMDTSIKIKKALINKPYDYYDIVFFIEKKEKTKFDYVWNSWLENIYNL